MKQFKVMGTVKILSYPRLIPWEIVANFEHQAKKNHGQTLERLNERGGLDPTELYAVCNGIAWREAFKKTEQEVVTWLIETVNTWKRNNGQPEWKDH